MATSTPSRTRTPRRLALAGLVAVAAALCLTSCTPSRYVAERGTVAIQARRLGILLSSANVSCKPGYDQMHHTCAAPVGPSGVAWPLEAVVGWVDAPGVDKVEMVNVAIPASFAKGGLRRTEKGYEYLTSCTWRPGAKGTWVVSNRKDEGCHTVLRDQYGTFVEEI